MPAFAIKMSICPNSRRIPSAAAWIAAASVTSHGNIAALAPFASHSEARFSSCSRRRATRPSTAPRSAIVRANPSPIPLDAPVTKITLSFQSISRIIVHFYKGNVYLSPGNGYFLGGKDHFFLGKGHFFSAKRHFLSVNEHFSSGNEHFLTVKRHFSS